MSNLIIENQQKNWSNISMIQVIDKRLNFDVQSWRFLWPIGEPGLYLTGGFIDSTKKKCYRVLNAYQVIAAAVSRNPVNVIIGRKTEFQNDLIEIPIDFSMNNFYVLNPEMNKETEK